MIKEFRLELSWTRKGASLRSPNGTSMPLRIDNFCPHMARDSLTDILGTIGAQDKARKNPREKKRRRANQLMSMSKTLRLIELRLRTRVKAKQHRNISFKQSPPRLVPNIREK